MTKGACALKGFPQYIHHRDHVQLLETEEQDSWPVD